MPQRQGCIELAKLYRECLCSIPGVEYTFAFEMGNSATSLDYFLIFATKNKKGLEAMKEAMRKIDASGRFSFYDSSAGQMHLIRFDEPEYFIEPLVEKFRGQEVPWKAVEQWILCETPLISFRRDVLKPAALRGLLYPIGMDGEPLSNKAQFPEGKVRAIRFKE